MTNERTVLIAAVIIAVAIVLSTFMVTHSPTSTQVTPEIACLNGGGTWDIFFQSCVH